MVVVGMLLQLRTRSPRWCWADHQPLVLRNLRSLKHPGSRRPGAESTALVVVKGAARELIPSVISEFECDAFFVTQSLNGAGSFPASSQAVAMSLALLAVPSSPL